MALLYSSEFKCTAYKVRVFDNDIRTRPSIVTLVDCDINCIIPTVVDYDNVIYYVRNLESVDDPFTSSKDDVTSFFSINEKRAGLMQSTYISTNLKVITPLSEALDRPLSRFDSVRSISSSIMSQSGSDDYVALSFEDVNDYANIEIVRPGMACVICNYTGTELTARDRILFPTGVDTTDIKFAGIVSDMTLASNMINTAYCSYYYGVFYVTSDSIEHFFALTASSMGYLYIDGDLLISQTTMNSVTEVVDSVVFQKGYHTFLIKHYASSTTTNDTVRLRLKVSEAGTYINFTVADLAAVNILLYTFPVDKHDVVSDTAYSEAPSILDSPSLDSLHIKKYRPIIVLARKHSALLQKEFDRLFYIKTPSAIDTSLLTSGTSSNLLSANTFPMLANGIILNCDRNTVLSPYITYTYNEAVKISLFELIDTNVYDSVVADGMQCFSFTFSIVNHLKERIRASDLMELLDIPACRNVSSLQFVNNSDTYLRVLKIHHKFPTRIVFKDFVQVRELTVRDPVVPGVEWGAVLSLRVYLKATEIVKMIDNNGEMSILQNLEDSTLISVDYDGLGYIPSVFDHKNITADVQYGAEFIMFCLQTIGSATPVETLGNIYKIYNYDTNTVFDSTQLLNVRQLDQIDDRKFEVVSNVAKTASYEFAYTGFVTSTDTIIQSDFTTVIVAISNTSLSTLTNNVFSVTVPNIGSGYTGVNDALVSVPVVGVLSNDTLTSDADLWDTNTVKIQVPSILAESTVYITLSAGAFSATSSITGTPATTYTYVPDLIQLPVIAVQVPLLSASSVHDIVLLTTDTVPTPTLSSLSVPSALTLAVVSVVELTGITRNDVEVTIDVSDIIHTFKCPLRVFDGTTRQPVNTVGVNNDNSLATTYNDWDGYRIRFKATLPGGQSSLYLVRVGNFEGSVGEFTQAVQADLRHNLHFSGSLVDSKTGTVGVDGGVAYNSDKTLQYYRALQILPPGYAKLAVTTDTVNYSISFWFATVLEDVGILCFSSSATLPAAIRDLEFSITPEGYLQCVLYSGAGATLLGTNKIYADSQWHHVVLTSSSVDGLKLYLDTKHVASAPVLTRTIATTLAYLGWGPSYFDGMLDEFRVYDKCLTQLEVTMLNSIFDGTITETEQRYGRTTIVHSPASRVTTLSDISALQGTPVSIYKYRGIDETILRSM